MYRVLNIMLAMLVGAATARASPFWVTWDEGWPNEQGWLEGWSIPAEKWLDGSLLYIDSRAAGGYDGYCQYPATLMPGAGETFSLFWRTRVDESTPSIDPGVVVRADDHYSVNFMMTTERVDSMYEPGKSAAFAPGVFHDFLVTSSDMRAYNLYIDGVLALQGNFLESLFPGPYVAWGDLASSKSLTAWDTVQYGLLPEPSALSCLLCVLCNGRSLRRSANPRSG